MNKPLNQPSVMGHNFSQIPHADIQRSTFKRNHGHKTTFSAGDLIPIYCDEALPGDTFSVNMSSVSRLLSPLQRPVMDNIFIDFFFFAVPNRLLWENWQRFMGEQDNPADSIDYLVPQLTSPGAGFAEGSIYDYMGLPIGVGDLDINTLHLRAYNLIWNQWFRDQNLQDSVDVPLDDGPDADTDFTLLKRGKRHDYFTSCLPWPQKGDSVDLPLGDSAPITGLGMETQTYGESKTVYLTDGTSGQAWTDARGVHLTNSMAAQQDPNNTGYPNIRADLSNATAATINSLREAFQLQKMLERDARGGTRYTEILRSHFRVTSPDARLQRPEYLGGGSTPITVTPIAQTSASDSAAVESPQGTLSATAYHQQSGIGWTKSFVEHSVILGLASVRCDLTYQNCINRMWSRQTKYDFYWPALAHLGEMSVLNKEIHADGSANDALVFGYQERWADYRYKPSQITGALRSQATTSLDVWHLSQDFSTLPVLNSSFIQENPPINRIVAVTDEDTFLFDGYFAVKTTRPMPMYSVPGMIDHF